MSEVEVDGIPYLLSLQAVRERAQAVLQIARDGALKHFEYDESRMPAVAEYVIGIINVSQICLCFLFTKVSNFIR